MTSSLVRDPSIRRIAVFRALHLGDLLCATPALHAIRAAWPRAHITLIGLAQARGFVDRQRDCIDDLMVFPGYPGFAECDHGPAAFDAFIQDARGRKFDLAIQLHGSGHEINAVVARLGARYVAGFHPYEEAAPSPHHCAWPENGHEIDRLLRLPVFLGAPTVARAPTLKLLESDRTEALTLLRSLGAHPDRYLVMHPGARFASRRWPIERFARVACALAIDGWQIVVTGSANEAQLARAILRAVEEAAPGRGFDACAQTSLGGLTALIAGAQLLISNDTGASHVAAAVGVRSVVVSSGGDALRWAPLDWARHRVLWHEVPCRPCGYEACPTDHGCALAIESDAVLREARARLSNRVFANTGAHAA